MPSEFAEEEWNAQEGASDGAAAVPADVADAMRQFVASLTSPESELEQQVLEASKRWFARNEPSMPAARNPCLAGSSMNNSRCSSPGDSSGRSAAGDTPPAAPAASSSGRSSEEGSSAAWRLCTWLQRQGWPAQHCASFRSGSSGGGGGGWRFASGHEFVLIYPHQCGTATPSPMCASDSPAASTPPSGATPSAGNGSTTSSSSSGGSGRGGGGGGTDTDVDTGSQGGYAGLADMACDAPAIVVDPEFSTQFALASPTPRYQVMMSLLPRVFVGTYDRLQRLVEWACAEMQGSFTGSGSGLPPWRSLHHVLSKWRVHGGSNAGDADADSDADQGMQEEHGQSSAQEAAEEPDTRRTPSQRERRLAGWRGAAAGSAPAPADFDAAAFSAEQQQTMRSLLLDPAQPATPFGATGAHALTASSSCSSMDAVSQAAGAPGPGATTPRSLLTRELHQLALATSKQPLEHGPAAGILSLAFSAPSPHA